MLAVALKDQANTMNSLARIQTGSQELVGVKANGGTAVNTTVAE